MQSEQIVRIAQAFGIPIKEKSNTTLIEEIKGKCKVSPSLTRQKVVQIALAFDIPTVDKTKYDLLERIERNCVSFAKNPFRIQSVLIPLWFTMDEVKQWLNKNKIQPSKVIQEYNHYRARVIEPSKGYQYITKKLNRGIRLVLVKNRK